MHITRNIDNDKSIMSIEELVTVKYFAYVFLYLHVYIYIYIHLFAFVGLRCEKKMEKMIN